MGIEYVDMPATPPIRVPCVRWQQAGYDVYSAICPKCSPGITAATLGEPIKAEGHGHVHTNQPGRIICKCGAYLELYLPE